MNICCSHAPYSMEQAVRFLDNPPAGSDFLELRVDRMSSLDFKTLLSKRRKNLIVTNRTILDGGYFAGDADDYRETLTQICEQRPAYVDYEWRFGAAFYKSLKKRFPTTAFVVSHHDIRATSGDLLPLYKKMRAVRPDVIKIVTTAKAIADNQAIESIIQAARNDRQRVICFSMGEYGQPSRILSGIGGAFLTFGFDSHLSNTAPGQFSVADLARLYRVNSLDRRTAIFGLVGNPVKFSKGYLYHNAAFARRRLNAVYVNFLADSFEEFVDSYSDVVRGISVTMPFKRDAAGIVTVRGDSSDGPEAVNTILFQRKKLVGYNTDFLAIAALMKRHGGFRKKRVTIAGTGGVAEAMICAATNGGGTVTLAGRNRDALRSLAGQYGCETTTFDSLAAIPADIFMNGTPVGMDGHAGTSLVDARYLKRVRIVFDAVSSPSETALINAGRKAGCVTITGKDLFEQQAAIQSRLFCGVV